MLGDEARHNERGYESAKNQEQQPETYGAAEVVAVAFVLCVAGSFDCARAAVGDVVQALAWPRARIALLGGRFRSIADEWMDSEGRKDLNCVREHKRSVKRERIQRCQSLLRDRG